MKASRTSLRLVLVGGGIFALIQSYSLLSPILLSLLLILLISLAANPVIARIRARAGGRRRATALAAALLLGFVALTAWALLGPMQESVTNLAEELPGYWERLQKPLIKMEQKALLSEGKLQAEVSSEISHDAAAHGEPEIAQSVEKPAAVLSASEPSSIRSHLSHMAQDVFGSFTALAFNGAQMLVVLVTVFFGVIFTLMDPRPIFGTIFSLVPERHHARALVIMKRIGEFVPAWAAATLLGMAAVGALVFLLMWPIFGFMDALVLGSIAGLLEALPFLGPVLSAVPALLLALGEGGGTLIWVVVAYVAVQAIESNVILPFVMARGMRLHPVSVMFSTLLCVAAFGVLGVLVAAPLVAIVSIVHDELYRKRFLPTTTDADLDRLAREALHEGKLIAR
jgi:predicted PurR-regulated permease PerM